MGTAADDLRDWEENITSKEKVDLRKCSDCKELIDIFEMSERGHDWLCPKCVVSHDEQAEKETHDD